MKFATEESCLRLRSARLVTRAFVLFLAAQFTYSIVLAQVPLAVALKPVTLKLLLLTGNGTEPSFLAMQTFLNQIGIPHDDVILAPVGQPAVSLPMLNDAAQGYYQGIILATGELGVCDATGTCSSALSAAGWAALDAYAATYGVRVLAYYTYPSARYGLNATGGYVNTAVTPTKLTISPTAGPLFPYLNAAAQIQVAGSWVYLATPVAATGESTTPLFSMNGSTVGALHTSATGEQSLALTFDNNPYLLHSLALNYGLINWVTHGVFLGSRHVYLTPQVDDLFIPNELFTATIAGCAPTGFLIDPTVDLSSNCPTDQVSGVDLTALAQWQTKLHASAQTAGFVTTLAFNGVGADDGNGTADLTNDLVMAARANAGNFFWVSHTYDHANLDCYDPVPNSGVCALSTTAEAAAEIDNNVLIAKSLSIKLDAQSMVTPEISGLANPNFIQTAVQRGIRYLVADTSKIVAPPPNTGLINPINPSILEIPRRPTSIFYNTVSAFAGDVGSLPDEYNYFYGPQGLIRIGGPGGAPFYATNQTYAQIIDSESDSVLLDMLRYTANPVMFHQSNLVRYDNVNSLYSDMIGATITKFTKLSNLPLISLTESDIGKLYQARMDYNASGVKAVWKPGSPPTVTITATRPATVPVTGFCQTACESYGGQLIAHILVSAGQPRTIQGITQ